VPVTKSKAALDSTMVIPAKSSGKPQLSLGTLKLGRTSWTAKLHNFQ